MPQPTTAQPKPESAALSVAFVALKTYDQGSSRAALLPIDDAVVAALADKAARKELERQLVTALKNSGSIAAREFVCSKLAGIGSKACVPALAASLNVPEVASAARNALEVIPDRSAAQALRDSLRTLQGTQRIGVINSLGARRDADSVRVLSKLLKDAEPGIAGAAGAALGEIGSSRAARALREFQPKTPESLRRDVADACLICAERLLAAGKRTDAEALYRHLSTTTQPKHVQRAVARGLENR